MKILIHDLCNITIRTNIIPYFIGLLILIMAKEIESKQYCISPNNNSIDCSGISDTILYMPNISSILHQATSITDDVIIYLANINNLPFYMLRESNPQPIFKLRSLTITPYYCIMNSNNKINQNCYNDISYLPSIYLKSDEAKMFISRFLNISNIIIDGSDLITQYYYNNLNGNALKCVTSNELCCTSNGINPYPDVKCNQTNRKVFSDWPYINGLFNFIDIKESLEQYELEIKLNNVKMRNLQFNGSASFIYVDAYGCNITLEDIELDNAYFYGGFLAIEKANISPICLDNNNRDNIKCHVNMNIQNSIFKNINLLYMKKAAQNIVPDGYILRVNTSYVQNISIINSNFESMISSTFRLCLTPDYFYLPSTIMNTNDLKSAYGSNLLQQYTMNYYSQLQSSALLIEIFDGNLILDSNRFYGIIGYSGAVLAINQLTETSSILIINNEFENNFAIMSGATIRIITFTSNYFQSYLCGKEIIIKKNRFLNNIGCPLSYSNVLIVCSGWTYDEIFYSLSYAFPTVNIDTGYGEDFYDYESKMTQKNISYQIDIEENIFSGNYISISTGISIHGYPIINIANNIFKDNSVLIELFGQSLITNYTINNQKPFKYTFFDNLNYLGSSPIYITAATWLSIHDNLFQNNSNVFSGDFLFGSQITLRDMIVLKDYIMIYSNIFQNNTGLPYEIRQKLNDKILKSGIGITLPLIIFNQYTITNSNFLNWAKNSSVGLISNINQPYITIKNCSFQYNNFTFNFDDQTYFDKIIYSSYSSIPESKIGFIKILLKHDLYTSNTTLYKEEVITIQIIDTNFSFNIFATESCGLCSTLIINFDLINSKFLNNSIYQYEYYPILGDNLNQDSISSFVPSFIDYGLICLSINSNEIYGPNMNYSSLDINDSAFERNTGEIIVQFGDARQSMIMISNTIFIDNTCNNSALIFINDNTILNLSYSNFSRNNAAYGCITAYSATYQGLFNIFQQNMGYHASVLFLEDSMGVENNSIIIGNIAGLGIEYMYFRGPTTVQSAIMYITQASYYSWFCNITENIAIAGIFYATSSELYLDSGIFINNTYPSYTNKISAILIFITSASYFTCKNYIITNNSGIGGSSRLSKIGLIVNYISFVEFINNTIHENLLTNYLTIIQAISANTTIEMTKFYNNAASYDSIDEPSLILGNYGYLAILNSTFENNSNILSIASANITIIESSFIDNNQINNEKIEFGIFLPMDITIINSLFTDWILSSNNISKSGYIISIVQQIGISIQNVTFSNMIYESGAIIQITGRSSLIINNSNFLNISFNDESGIITCNNIIGMEIYNTIFDSFNGPSTHISIDYSPQLKFLVENSSFYNSTDYIAISITQSTSIKLINVIIIPYPEFDQYYLDMNNTDLSLISGILMSDFKDIQIMNSFVKNTKCIFGTLNLIFQISNSTVSITNTTFENNIALIGGAIYISTEANNTNIVIQNCTFYRNIAINETSLLSSQLYYGKGGAIYYSCDRNMNYICNMTILDTIFDSNNASIAGGAIYWDYFPPYNNSNVIFVNNSAKYGPDLASYPVYMYPSYFEGNRLLTVNYDPISYVENKMMELNSIKNISSKVISGNRPIDDIKFSLFDIYGQIDITDNESNILIAPIQNLNDNYSIRANPSLIQVIQGQFSITNFSIDYYPLKNSTIKFTSSNILKLPNAYIQTIKSFNETIGVYMTNMNIPEYNITLNFIDCPIGYIFSKSTSNDNQYGICLFCANGTYSLDPQTFQKQHDRKCISCDYDIFKSCSGGYIYLQRGYWRMNATADIILKCPNEAYCPGNMNNTNFIKYDCNGSTQGNLCNQCPLGFAKFGSQVNCMDCSQDALYYILLFGMLTVQIIFIGYSVSCTMNESNEFDCNNQKIDSEELKSNLLKVLANYTQSISLINIFSAKFPTALIDTFGFMSYWSITTDQYFSFDCFIILLSTNSSIRILNIKLLGIFSSPIIGSIFAVLAWACIFKIKKQKILRNKDFFNKLVTSVVILIYSLQPNLLKYGFILFNCTNLYREDQPLYYLNADYDFHCWDNNHLGWALGLGLTNILLWGIMIPSISLVRLYFNRFNLNNNSIRLKYAFLYRGYKHERYYWEFVVLFRKFILITIIEFFNLLSNTLQVMIAISIIAMFLALQIQIKPFKNIVLNELEAQAQFSNLLIAFSTLYFLNNPERNSITDIIILSIMGFGYAYFIISWVWIFCKTIKEDIKKNQKKLQEIKSKIKQCFYCLIRPSNKIHIENTQFRQASIDSNILPEISQIMPNMNLPSYIHSNIQVNHVNKPDSSESKMEEFHLLDNYSIIHNHQKNHNDSTIFSNNQIPIENSYSSQNPFGIQTSSIFTRLNLNDINRFSPTNSITYNLQGESPLNEDHENLSFSVLKSKELDYIRKDNHLRNKIILTKKATTDSNGLSQGKPIIDAI